MLRFYVTLQKGKNTMIKIEYTSVIGFDVAIRGMRNPYNSWEESDSKYENGEYIIGDKDKKLMEKLVSVGTDHSKFMRFINVTCDITAPIYWWKEFDTYKVGTVRNSCSTMHTITNKGFELDDFSCENLEFTLLEFESYISSLNWLKAKYNEEDMGKSLDTIFDILLDYYSIAKITK